MRGLQALQPCSTSYLGLQFAQTALAAQSNTQHRSNGHRLQCQVSAMTAQPVVPIQAGPALASSQLLCSRACLHARLARQPRPPAAGLDEVAVGYDRALGNDALRNIFGTAYVVFVVWFAVRVLKRRAGRSMQKRKSMQTPDRIKAIFEEAERRSQEPTPAVSALFGALQSAFLCFLLFRLTSVLDDKLGAAPLPSQFVARNITLTVQEIVRAMAYLFTFLCGMNCLGMTGLTVQLLIWPETDQLRKGQ